LAPAEVLALPLRVGFDSNLDFFRLHGVPR
jgi:hypothetical protein